MKAYSKARIKSDFNELSKAYTCIVLGAGVRDDGSLSTYLQGRLQAALELYKQGKIKRFLLSGDHGKKNYDEVNAMKAYLLENGVGKDAIFLDHAGFNTYSTMVRAKKIFDIDDCIIVTQKFHIVRAVYIANKVGLHAQGYAVEDNYLGGIKYVRLREIPARTKSFFEVLFHLPPKYLGEKIPITGNSELSWD
ncbi:MAG: YdcF family protein [Chitinophagales bacterium]|nr:YdcF family protein [Chitinophagales bacterium]